MKYRPFVLMGVLFWATFALAAVPPHKLSKTDKPPEGVSDATRAQIETHGYSVTGPDGAVCTVWLAKKLPVLSNFQPGLSVKYPFTQGELIGVLQVATGATFTDFRGQEIPPGVYTFRYGQQPQDGNHIGTSDLSDFLLAIPAKSDQDPKPITDFDDLTQRSAETAGATHPAIFSLLPGEGAVDAAKLTHNDDRDFWILDVAGAGESDNKPVKVTLRLVLIGQSEG